MPRLTARRVTDAGDLDDAVRGVLDTRGPVLLDVMTNPDEVSLPPKTTVDEAWGLAIAKVGESLQRPAG